MDIWSPYLLDENDPIICNMDQELKELLTKTQKVKKMIDIMYMF